MPCTIVVANQCNLPKGEIVQVFDGKHKFSEKERMSVFVSKGGRQVDWTRPFTHVLVTDKSYDDLAYLTDYTETGERKWYFTEPVKNTPDWNTLYDTGEITRTWSVVSTFMGER